MGQLVVHGADLDLPNSEHAGPLHLAVLHGMDEAAATLSEAGALADTPGVLGLTALQVASMNDSLWLSLIQLLQVAVRRGSLETVKMVP